MANLQIENSPDELYSRIQGLAVECKLTLNEAVIHLLQQAFQSDQLTVVQEPRPTSEILAKIRSRPRVNPVDFGLLNSTVQITQGRRS